MTPAIVPLFIHIPLPAYIIMGIFCVGLIIYKSIKDRREAAEDTEWERTMNELSAAQAQRQAAARRTAQSARSTPSTQSSASPSNPAGSSLQQLNSEMTPIEYAITALESMGCHPERGNHHDAAFDYQGERFVIFGNSRMLFVRYIPWIGIEENDKDFDLYVKAANLANQRCIATVIYSNEGFADDSYYFYVRNAMMVKPDDKDIVKYLKFTLDMCFKAQHTFNAEFLRLRSLATPNLN